MEKPKPPKALSVQIVMAEPTESDSAMIAQFKAQEDKSLDLAAYLVMLKLERKPEPTGAGWALFVGNERIPKYTEYRYGVYFKVLDPDFLREHQGKPLRFSQNEVDFFDTGLKLAMPKAQPKTAASRAVAKLPRQDELLK